MRPPDRHADTATNNQPTPHLPQQQPHASDSSSWKTHVKRASLEPLLPTSSLSGSTLAATGSVKRSAGAYYRSCLDGLRSNVGFLYVALAGGCFTVINTMVALLSTDEDARVPTSELMFTRMLITGFFCYLVLRIQGDPHPALGPPDVRKLLVVRGVVGFFGISSVYFALSFISVSDVTTINFLVPLCTGIGAALILGEPYKPIEAAAALVSLASVTLIAKPSFIFGQEATEPVLVDGRQVTEKERLTAVGFLMLGVLGGTGAYLTIRCIGHRASALHSMLYFSYYSCFVSLILAVLFPSQRFVLPRSTKFVIALFAVGILGFLAQTLLTMGLQKEKAGRAASASYLQLPLAMILDRVVFGLTPDFLSLLGSVLIIGSALTVVWKHEAKPASDEAAGTPLRASSTSYTIVSQEERDELDDDDNGEEEDRATLRDTSVLDEMSPTPRPRLSALPADAVKGEQAV